jgi:hypothetical protein
VDKWAAAARLWTVATAPHLSTAIIHHDGGHGLPGCEPASISYKNLKASVRSRDTDDATRSERGFIETGLN